MELDLKSKIILGALEVFCIKGYTPVSLSDIMHASNVSKEDVMKYFNSKEEIFYAIEDYFYTIEESYFKQLDFSKNPEQLFREYMSTRINVLRDPRTKQMVNLTSEFWSLPTIKDKDKNKLVRRYDSLNTDLSFLITYGIEKGVFKPNLDIEKIIYTIISVMVGITPISLYYRKPVTDEQIEFMLDGILSYIKED